MDIIISNTSDKPIYQQIYEQIYSQIIKGELPSDFCLPPIRTVAKELRISVITVKKAWEELEHMGFIYTVAGKGCFIAPLHENEIDDKRSELIKDKMLKDFEYYKSLGLSKEELIDIVDKYYS